MIGQSIEQIYRLAEGLPDQRLLAVLQGHDNVIPEFVAKAVADQRAEMRRNAQPMQQPPQPTGKQQTVAELEQGIAAVPTPNMAHFAEGGVVGFADTGAVSEEERRKRARWGEASANGWGWSSSMTPINGSGSAFTYRPEVRDTSFLPVPLQAARTAIFGNIPYLGNPAWTDQSQRFPGKPPGVVPATERDDLQVPMPPDKMPEDKPIDLTDWMTRFGWGAKGGNGAPTINMPTEPTLPAARNIAPPKLMTVEQGLPGILATLKANSGIQAPKSAEEETSNEEEMMRKRGINTDFIKDAKARLAAEAAKDPEERKQAGWMALMKAGLGIMGGTSPYALANIGNGAMQGLDQYTGDIKELKKAAKERDKALLDLDKANYDIESGKVTRGIDRATRAQDRYTQAMTTLSAAGLGSLDAANNRAVHLYGAQQQSADQQRQTEASFLANLFGTKSHLAGVQAQVNASHAAANRMPPEIQLGLMLGNGNLEKGLTKLYGMRYEPRADAATEAEWTKITNEPTSRIAWERRGISSLADYKRYKAESNTGGTSTGFVSGKPPSSLIDR